MMPRERNMGKALADACKKANISMAKMAEMVGCSRPSAYNWARGRSVSPAYRAKVKKVLARLESR